MSKSRTVLYMRHYLNHSSTYYKTRCLRAVLNVIERSLGSMSFEITVLLGFEHYLTISLGKLCHLFTFTSISKKCAAK